MLRALTIYAALSIAYLIVYGAVVPLIKRRRARRRLDARLRAMAALGARLDVALSAA